MGGPGRGAFCGIAVVDDHVVQPLVPWEMSFERTPTQTDLIGRVLLCRFGVFLGLFPSVVPPHARCTHDYDHVCMWNDVYGYLYDFCFFLDLHARTVGSGGQKTCLHFSTWWWSRPIGT